MGYVSGIRAYLAFVSMAGIAEGWDSYRSYVVINLAEDTGEWSLGSRYFRESSGDGFSVEREVLLDQDVQLEDLRDCNACSLRRTFKMCTTPASGWHFSPSYLAKSASRLSTP